MYVLKIIYIYFEFENILFVMYYQLIKKFVNIQKLYLYIVSNLGKKIIVLRCGGELGVCCFFLFIVGSNNIYW